jgi:hypothetical protein
VAERKDGSFGGFDRNDATAQRERNDFYREEH